MSPERRRLVRKTVLRGPDRPDGLPGPAEGSVERSWEVDVLTRGEALAMAREAQAIVDTGGPALAAEEEKFLAEGLSQGRTTVAMRHVANITARVQAAMLYALARRPGIEGVEIMPGVEHLSVRCPDGEGGSVEHTFSVADLRAVEVEAE